MAYGYNPGGAIGGASQLAPAVNAQRNNITNALMNISNPPPGAPLPQFPQVSPMMGAQPTPAPTPGVMPQGAPLPQGMPTVAPNPMGAATGAPQAPMAPQATPPQQ